MSKKLKYSRQLTRREKNRQKYARIAREASERADAQWRAERLAHYAERARQAVTESERRALCREVWAERHKLPRAIDTVKRILNERDAH